MATSVSLKSRPQGGSLRTSDKKGSTLWECRQPLSLTCAHHGDQIWVPCGRWRVCPGCALRLQFQLTRRLETGIANVPAGLRPMFFTLTFPADRAPTEAEAQKAWRSLVRRLRYRGLLGEYGWVLQRQQNGTLHFHGIAQMPWMNDRLATWRELVVASGFGPQNKLVVANPAHARYCARYMSHRLARLDPLRRAYQFSPSFPRPPAHTSKSADSDSDLCDWLPTATLRALLRSW